MDTIQRGDTTANEVLIDGLFSRIDAAEKAGVMLYGDASTLRRNARDIRDRATSTALRLEQIKQDARYSEDGRRQFAADVTSPARDAIRAYAADASERVKFIVEKRRREALELKPPGPASTLEQRLANARHDAELQLRGASRPGDIIQGLEELARDGDETTRHLVLGTPWPSALLKGAGASPQMLRVWRETHARLLTEVLDEGTVTKLQALAELEKVPTLFDALVRGTIGRTTEESSIRQAFAQGSQR